MASLDRRDFLLGVAGGVAGVGGLSPHSGGLAPGAADLSRRALRELRAAVRGRVTVPSGSAALVYNTRFDGRRPDAVVHVRDTADVAAAVRWADRVDVPGVARSRGATHRGVSPPAGR